MTMNSRKTAAIAAVVLTGGVMLVTTAALARGSMEHELDFATLDMDGNGEITATEFAEFKVARIAALDTDGDGFIGRDELSAMRKKVAEDRAGKHYERLLGRVDANEDGLLSIEELASHSGRRGGDEGFPRGLDADGNGSVSAEEFAQAKDRWSERKGKRGKKHKSDAGEAEGGSE